MPSLQDRGDLLSDALPPGFTPGLFSLAPSGSGTVSRLGVVQSHSSQKTRRMGHLAIELWGFPPIRKEREWMGHGVYRWVCCDPRPQKRDLGHPARLWGYLFGLGLL